MNSPTYKYVSDSALLIEFGTSFKPEFNQQVVQLDQGIAAANIVGVKEVVPGLVNLLLLFDPLLTDHASVQAAVESLFPLKPLQRGAQKHHVINVCYEKEFAPDLQAVATACGVSIDAVANAHCSSDYSVGMYGFSPGWAYLSGVPELIHVPRKSAAVRDKPAGSVMIAGTQCIVTTLKMPTGWSIIGRSDANIMTGKPDQPFLFSIGDSVTFQRVGRETIIQSMQ